MVESRFVCQFAHLCFPPLGLAAGMVLTACYSGLVCVLQCGLCAVVVVEGEAVGWSLLGAGSIHEYRMCHISVGYDETSGIWLAT